MQKGNHIAKDNNSTWNSHGVFFFYNEIVEDSVFLIAFQITKFLCFTFEYSHFKKKLSSDDPIAACHTVYARSRLSTVFVK